MRRLKILLCFCLTAFMVHATAAAPKDRPAWQSRWLLEATGNVFSPGGADKSRYTTSLGGGLALTYWVNWNTQLMASIAFSNLNTNAYYWLPFNPADTSFTISNLDVTGGLKILSVEARRLFPSDRQNFLYLGAGLDYFSFATVKGSYYMQQSYPPTAPHTESFKVNRDPSWAVGLHISPGLFFLLYPKIPVDITVRFHALYDGKNSLKGWIEPAVAIGFRIK